MEGKEVKMIQSCANCMNDKPFFGGNCGDCSDFSNWELKDCLPCIEQWGEQIRIYEHQIEKLQEEVEQLKNSKFEKNEKMTTKPEDPYYRERYSKLENAYINVFEKNRILNELQTKEQRAYKSLFNSYRMLNRVQQDMVEDLQKAKKIIISILKMVGEENFNNDVIKNAKQFCDKI
jgi:hypothetical protein